MGYAPGVSSELCVRRCEAGHVEEASRGGTLSQLVAPCRAEVLQGIARGIGRGVLAEAFDMSVINAYFGPT